MKGKKVCESFKGHELLNGVKVKFLREVYQVVIECIVKAVFWNVRV